MAGNDDGLTAEEQRQIFDWLESLPSRQDISLITSETAVPLKITWRILALFGSLAVAAISLIWWGANDRAEFRRELMSQRTDMVTLAETTQTSIRTTISELDSTWQLRFQSIVSEMTARQVGGDSLVRETLLRLESRLPTQQDYDDLRKRIEALEKAIQMKSAVRTKEVQEIQSVGPCF